MENLKECAARPQRLILPLPVKSFMVSLQGESSVDQVVFERVKGPLNGKWFIFQRGVMDLCGEQFCLM